MPNNVARLRRLLAEAIPDPAKSPRATAELFVLDQSPRARTQREVLRLAERYGWEREIYRFLDEVDALSLASLSDDALERLLARLRKFEDCLQEGLDHPDCAPAR